MAVSVDFYDRAFEFFCDSSMDIDDDTFKGELYNSSHSFTGAHTQRSDISANALATGNGYTNPGQNLSSVTWTTTSAVQTWDCADIVWTANSGSIGPARHCAFYDDTAASDLLVLNIDFGQDETAGDGTDFRISPHASGIFTGAVV